MRVSCSCAPVPMQARYAAVQHLTSEPWAQHMASQTRRAATSGPALCAVHRQAGLLLAAQLLAPTLPLRSTSFSGVQGPAQGSQFADSSITIVSLERAGRSLAEGVWQLLPGAAFVAHRGKGEPFSSELVTGRVVVLCDAVVNSGASVSEALEALAALRPLRVAVLCLVMQEGAQALALRYPLVQFCSMRLSVNKFKGQGGTDTGNRLYNTTCLD
jgi:uracil phosphoribosyltransferase